MKALLIVLCLALGARLPAFAQKTPFDGPIDLQVDELVVESQVPTLAVKLSTVQHYPCSDLQLLTEARQEADSIGIVLLGLIPVELCAHTFGPASGRVPLPLSPGTYTLSVTRERLTDSFELTITSTQVFLRAKGTSKFIHPDTSLFLRPRPHSFLVSCGTPNVPELCADFATWLAHQRGLVRRPLDEASRIGFPRYGGYWYNAYFLYEYTGERSLDVVRRCMRHLADTLSAAVGAGITLQTREGEVLRAWSGRSNHEPHIPVPRKVSMSRECS